MEHWIEREQELWLHFAYRSQDNIEPKLISRLYTQPLRTTENVLNGENKRPDSFAGICFSFSWRDLSFWKLKIRKRKQPFQFVSFLWCRFNSYFSMDSLNVNKRRHRTNEWMNVCLFVCVCLFTQCTHIVVMIKIHHVIFNVAIVAFIIVHISLFRFCLIKTANCQLLCSTQRDLLYSSMAE